MTDNTNFLSILGTSDTVAGRWSEVVQAVVAHGQALGVTLDEADVLTCRAARSFALGANIADDELVSEVAELAPVIAAKQEEAERQKIADGDPSAIARLNELPPDQRITAARRAGLSANAATQEHDELSETQALEVVLQIENPSERLRVANKLGIGRGPVSDRRERRLRGR